jgi:EAL domain-containing protein (putative c-di-GMP-specific phosphodiesterase class I)
MDPVDVILNQDKIIPYYKPIISADTQLVTGYEVVAFFQKEDGSMQNLDWFFKDPSIPDEFLLEVMNHIIKQALHYYLNNETEHTLHLLFRYDGNILYKDRGENLINLLNSYHDKNINLNKIAIQLKDEFSYDQLQSVDKVFQYMKSYGLKIAFEDTGERNGNFERLAFLKPNIIKVDVGFLNDEDLPHLYQDVHHSLSLLARKIGATLMFKGITSYNQLNYAWRNGGRFYQGDFLHRSEPGYVSRDCCKDLLEQHFQQFINYERKKVHAQLALTNRIHQLFKTVLSSIDSKQNLDELTLAVGKKCSPFAFRVYVCNDQGLQVSADAVKRMDGTWELRQEERMRNWSWRPFFFENIARMNIEKKGLLSDLYTDIEKNELIRTYSFPLSESLFIFIDIPYDFLFEQDGLL